MFKLNTSRTLSKSLRSVAGEIWKNTVCARCAKRTPRWQGQWSRVQLHSTSSPVIDNAMVAKTNCNRLDVVRQIWSPRSESIKRFSNSTSQNDPDKFHDLHLLESWNGVVHPFGKLRVSGPFNVHVSSLNPHEHPGMDKAFVSIYAQKMHGQEIWQCGDLVKTKVNVSDQGKLLSINGEKKENSKDGPLASLECVLQVPIRFGLDLEVEDHCCVNVSNLESTGVKIKLDTGDCILRNVKTGFAGVESVGGNIRCENILQGNIDLKTGQDGAVFGEKFLGSQLRVQTYAGQIQIQTIYGENGVFWSNTGTIHLGSCHGDTSIEVYNGDINIESLDGNLTTRIKTFGNFDAYLSRHENVDINIGKGNVSLKLPDTVQTGIELTANSVNVGDGFKGSNVTTVVNPPRTTVSGRLGSSDVEDQQEEKITVSLRKGHITVESCDWLTSVKNRKSWRL